MTMIDSERHLRCLSLKPTLRFVAMSSSFSSSQMIRDTTGSTSISGSVPTEDESAAEFGSMLAAEEDTEEVETEGDVGGGATAF